MPQPLEGITVVDWTIWQQGPVCSAMLADMGADVIKVEQRGTGDPGRWLTAAGGRDTGDQPNWYFEANNRNKRSITLDLKKPEGLEVMLALVAKSDVFVQNFRKGVAGRIGLGYDALSKNNPGLIYASATGYGPEGPDSGEPSFDYLGLARSGIMNAIGEPDMPPLGISGGIADQMGAIMMAYGVMTALVARERHGIGQEVDASHLGSMAFLQGLSLSMKLMAGVAMPRSFRSGAFNALWNHYRCADDRWIAFAMAQADRWWPDFARTLGREDLVEDERFASMMPRGANSAALIAILDEIFATRTRAEWMERLDAGGDFIFSIVNSVSDLPDDPQIRANDLIASVEHPTHGSLEMLELPIGFSETPASIRGVAPEFGQHTEQILVEELGYSWDEVSALREDEVI
jgi:crotonobetainyl-CoA:carnitine CoA-transferase CaiB-like acyl-CoA transferase